MPKGDRLKLKADPEDGTTPIANLLLEAVAMAKISGLQKGAILYLWRKTYGWVGQDGKRLKECKITLTEWKKALDSTAPSLSRTLTELEDKAIIIRRIADNWGGYYYSLNTNISKWNSSSINLAKLAEVVGITDFATVTQPSNSYPTEQQLPKPQQLPKKVVTVTQTATQQLPKPQHLTLYKETLNKDINKEGDVKITSPVGEKTKEVFSRLDKLRGYRPTKRKAEAASIIRMLKSYTPDQIINTWQKLKEDKFYKDKELFMMTVESQIGASLVAGTKNKKPSKYNDNW